MNNVTDLIEALDHDKALIIGEDGMPHIPNAGWAGRYANVGLNISISLNTLMLVRSFSSYLEEDDEKDLRIIAHKVGYEVEVEATTILFRQYNAWED